MGRYAKTNYQIKKIQNKFKNLGSSTGQTSQSQMEQYDENGSLPKNWLNIETFI